MHGRAGTDDGELLLEAKEVDDGAIRLVPRGAPAWTPSLLAGGLVGNGYGGGEQILALATPT